MGAVRDDDAQGAYGIDRPTELELCLGCQVSIFEGVLFLHSANICVILIFI